MKKWGRILTISASVLFLFSIVSCGIPRMFPWDSVTQYNISTRQLDFRTSFQTETSGSGAAEITSWSLVPSRGTPVIRLYYIVTPTAESPLYSNVTGMASSFSSRFRSSFPPTYDEEPAYTRSFETAYTDDETISVSMWEMTVIRDDGSYEPASRIFQGVDYFTGNGGTHDNGIYDQYIATYEFSTETAGSGYYILMNLNGTTYRLGRMNGKPFSLNLADYYDDDSEFLPEDSEGLMQDATLNIYLGASFAFENFTSRQTVPLVEVHRNSLLAP